MPPEIFNMTTITRILIITCFCCLAYAEDKVHEYHFDNGLKLLVLVDDRFPVVVSQVWYKVGGGYEYDGITGISHALEHMMFKGTTDYPDGEFSKIIADNGGQDNAFTGKDYTAYYQVLEKSRLAVSFELEADRMQNLLLLDEEFAPELKVVIEERRWRTEDKPQSYAYEVMVANAYQLSPYRHPVVGWMHDLNNMTISDLKQWYQSWYHPANATIVVVGDVKPEAVYALAQKYFADIPKKTVEYPPIVPKDQQLGMKQIKVKRPAKLAYLLMAYRVPILNPKSTKDDWQPYALEVLASILSGGSSTRLPSRLIRGQAVATSASASYAMVGRQQEDLFVLSATPAQGKSRAELKAALKQQIDQLKTQLVSEEELQQVKTQVIAENIYQKDSIFYRALILGVLETIGLSWQLADQYVDEIQAITVEQLQQVARQYLIDDRLIITELEPLPLTNETVAKPAMRH